MTQQEITAFESLEDAHEAVKSQLNNEYISEVIGDEFKQWKGSRVYDTGFPQPEGDCIYISSGTGTGKTYFIFNVLAKYAKEMGDKILYLCNRTTLKNDVIKLKEELGATNIDIKTYQAVARIIAQQRKTWDEKTQDFTEEYQKRYRDLLQYKYIVADEMHYFLEDASYNLEIYYVHRFLLGGNSQIKILISATAGYAMWMFLEKITAKYDARSDKSYMHFTLYKDNRKGHYDFPVETLREMLTKNDTSKAIYFVDTVERINEIWEKHEDLRDEIVAMFSESKEDPYNIRDNNCIYENEEGVITFDKRILLATSILSNGVTLKDRHIKHIICDIGDILTAIQCIGRKRAIDQHDKCDIYLRFYHGTQIKYQGERFGRQYAKLVRANNNRSEMCDDYGLDFKQNEVVIDWLDDGRAKVNKPLMEYCYQQIQIYQKLLRYDEESKAVNGHYSPSYAYAQTFMHYFGKKFEYEVVDTSQLDYCDMRRIEQLLEEYRGVEATSKSDTIKSFKKALKECGVKIQIEEINSVISRLGYKVDMVRKKIDGKQVRFWSIKEIQ